MKTDTEDQPPWEEPLATLERELLTAYVAGAGEDLHAVLNRHDQAAQRLLAEASVYASSRLTEVEARLHYLRSLRGEV
jgi:hypothetical protein